MYKKRHIENLLNDLKKMYSAVLLVGARQVGKTTCLEAYTGLEKVSMDDGLTRALAEESPATFLKTHTAPVLLDEVQKVPSLFSQIKYEIDRDRTKKALYFMTGSEQPQLMQSSSESLSGRIGIAKLFGFSLRELFDIDVSEPFLPMEAYFEKRKYRMPTLADDELWRIIHRGLMPELILNDDFRWDVFYASYLNTYIERDVRSEIGNGNETKFAKFLVACAAMCGELLNLSSLSREVGISQTTAERWMTKLCETNVVYLLQPYFSNVKKRVIKTPKLYFTDTGLAAYLTKWNTAGALQNGAFAGHIFENFVVMEILKSYFNQSPSEPAVYFYRDTNRREIDLIIQEGDVLHPLEIKKTADPTRKMTAAFSELDNIAGVRRGSGGIICRRDDVAMISETDFVIPVEFL